MVATAGGSQSFAPEMTGRASQRVALEKALRQALEEGGLALDRLEVDQAFVRDLLGDRDDVAIVDHPGIRPLAQAARGRRGNVETEARLQFLKTRGCDEIQGYGLSRPVSRAVAGAAAPGSRLIRASRCRPLPRSPFGSP